MADPRRSLGVIIGLDDTFTDTEEDGQPDEAFEEEKHKAGDA
jgi:hypothetical protein